MAGMAIHIQTETHATHTGVRQQEGLWQEWWCDGNFRGAIGGACNGVRNSYDEGRASDKWRIRTTHGALPTPCPFH